MRWAQCPPGPSLPVPFGREEGPEVKDVDDELGDGGSVGLWRRADTVVVGIAVDAAKELHTGRRGRRRTRCHGGLVMGECG